MLLTLDEVSTRKRISGFAGGTGGNVVVVAGSDVVIISVVVSASVVDATVVDAGVVFGIGSGVGVGMVVSVVVTVGVDVDMGVVEIPK